MKDRAYVPAAQLGAGAEADFLVRWIATELRGADEPSLYEAASHGGGVAYRVTTLGPWGGAEVLRLEKRTSGWILVRKRTVPLGSWERSVRMVREADSLSVSAMDGEHLVRLVVRSDRWRRPAPTCRNGLDGYDVLLEALDDAGYALALCWVPEPATAPAIVATIRAFEELAWRTFDQPRGK